MTKRFLGVITVLRELTGNRPDNSLPPVEGPVDPDYGIGIEHPDQGLPVPPEIWPQPPQPPVGIWPDPGTPAHPIVTPPPGRPSHPIYIRPPGQPSLPIYIPVGPEHPIVMPPEQPGAPGAPAHPIAPGGGAPAHPIARPPGEVAHPIWPPPHPANPIHYPNGPVYILVYIPYLGWKYVVVDMGAHPDQGLPEPQLVPTPHQG